MRLAAMAAVKCVLPVENVNRYDVGRSYMLYAVQDPVAIKIFTHLKAFANEQRAYNLKAVVDAVGVPPTFVPNKDGKIMMPKGTPYPPFMVTAKAQPLDNWVTRFGADSITSMQVCCLPANSSKIIMAI